jgi:hypothetical protein
MYSPATIDPTADCWPWTIRHLQYDSIDIVQIDSIDAVDIDCVNGV